MSCRCRKIDCASVRGLTAHGYSLIARKPAVGVGATWRFAGTPPSLGASTHARVSGARVDVMSEGNNQLRGDQKSVLRPRARGLSLVAASHLVAASKSCRFLSSRASTYSEN